MVHLPRTCQYCGEGVMHYGSCICPKARLSAIEAERRAITLRLARLDEIESQILWRQAETAITSKDTLWGVSVGRTFFGIMRMGETKRAAERLALTEPTQEMQIEGAKVLHALVENSAEYRAGHAYRAMVRVALGIDSDREPRIATIIDYDGTKVSQTRGRPG